MNNSAHPGNNEYDVIIAGAGIAGLTASIALQYHGLRCLILEKRPSIDEKVCGGGIYHKAIERLIKLGIVGLDEFLEKRADRIYGIKSHFIDRVESTHLIQCGQFSAGVLRKDFDNFLLNAALSSGAEIRFGIKVGMPALDQRDFYRVGNLKARHFICAIGARGLQCRFPLSANCGYALTGIIENHLSLSRHLFHYWYKNTGQTEYFWAFPVAKDKWNVGYYSMEKPSIPLVAKYRESLSRFLSPVIDGQLSWIILPRSARIGTHDFSQDEGTIGIGDYAGLANPRNGGGIWPAITSALRIARSLAKPKELS